MNAATQTPTDNAVAGSLDEVQKSISVVSHQQVRIRGGSSATSVVPWLDRSFFENRRKVAPETLPQYAGQYVAWSWDGTRILAGDPGEDVLRQKIAANGDSRGVVYGYVDDGAAIRR